MIEAVMFDMFRLEGILVADPSLLILSMKLQRSPQGLTLFVRSPIQAYVTVGAIAVVWLPSIKFFVDLILQVAQPTGNAGFVTNGLKVLVLLLMLPSVINVVAQLWRKTAEFQVRSGVIDSANQHLTLYRFNRRCQQQTLNFPTAAIAAIQLLYYGSRRGAAEAKYGLRLKPNQGSQSGFELDEGTLSLEQAQALAQTIQRELALPMVSEPLVDPCTIAPSWFFQCLAQTPNRLSFKIDYSLMTMGACAVCAILGLLCLGSSSSLITATLGPQTAIGVQLIGYVTPMAMIWLMQVLGFQETWQFDRASSELRYERHLLFGRRVNRYSNQQVVGIVIEGTDVSESGYRVAIDAPSLKLLQNHGKLRVLYQSFDLKCAQDFAQRLRYYLNRS
jgi:hypothetical protein